MFKRKGRQLTNAHDWVSVHIIYPSFQTLFVIEIIFNTFSSLFLELFWTNIKEDFTFHSLEKQESKHEENEEIEQQISHFQEKS